MVRTTAWQLLWSEFVRPTETGRGRVIRADEHQGLADDREVTPTAAPGAGLATCCIASRIQQYAASSASSRGRSISGQAGLSARNRTPVELRGVRGRDSGEAYSVWACDVEVG